MDKEIKTELKKRYYCDFNSFSQFQSWLSSRSNVALGVEPLIIDGSCRYVVYYYFFEKEMKTYLKIIDKERKTRYMVFTDSIHAEEQLLRFYLQLKPIDECYFLKYKEDLKLD